MKHFQKCLSLIISLLFISNFISAAQTILAVSQIVEKYGKAVVLIATVKGAEGTVGLGSGFIVNPSGVIITNYHVIKGAYPAVVKLVNGDLYEDISIIDIDETKDIAIIKVKAWSLPIVNLGNSDSVKVGEHVVVIGNPRGLENTVTDGLISAVRDSGEGYKMHQISAPISPGSSGSPVFNMKGEVVGIATASLVEGQNLNFSLPINYARGMISDQAKISLEEFSKKPTKEVLSFPRSLEANDIKECLSKLNEIIIEIYRGLDNCLIGYTETTESHVKGFQPNKFSISTFLYAAKEIISNAYDEILLLKCNDKNVAGILDELEKVAEKIKLGIEIELQGLKKYPQLSSYPDWDSVKEGNVKIFAATGALQTKINSKFLILVNEKFPELKDKILPIVVLSSRPLIEQKLTLGVFLSTSASKGVRIIVVIKGTPADKAQMKMGDVILGTIDGEKFDSIIEFYDFMNERKPGEDVTFEIDRKGTKLQIPVKLEVL